MKLSVFFIEKLFPPPVEDTIAKLCDVLLLFNTKGSKNIGNDVYISTPNIYPVESLKYDLVNGKPALNVNVGKYIE